MHYLAGAVRSLPIDLHLGKTATRENIAAQDVDHVILATGAIRAAPPLPARIRSMSSTAMNCRGAVWQQPRGHCETQPTGAPAALRWSPEPMLRSIKLLRLLSHLWMPIAREVVIIGGGLVGLELAEYLVERRRKVTVLEPGPDLGAELCHRAPGAGAAPVARTRCSGA